MLGPRMVSSNKHHPIWLWVKIKPPGDRRFWSIFPFTRVPFWAPIVDPQPYRVAKRQVSWGPQLRREVPGALGPRQRRLGDGQVSTIRVPHQMGGFDTNQKGCLEELDTLCGPCSPTPNNLLCHLLLAFCLLAQTHKQPCGCHRMPCSLF